MRDQQDMYFKALCPSCGGKGCNECDSGYVQVAAPLPTSTAYTIQCQKCGSLNCMRLVGPGLPPLPDGNRLDKYASCLECGASHDDLRYVNIEDLPEDESGGAA